MDKKRGKRNSRGQSQIPFGMIFSVILMKCMINKFIEVQRFAQVGKFKSDFQTDIDKMWKSTQGSQSVTYYLPKSIKQVCFQERENPRTLKDENMYFMPDDESQFDGALLDNLNIVATTTGLPNGRLCIDVVNGKISMIIKKGYNENLVTITK